MNYTTQLKRFVQCEYNIRTVDFFFFYVCVFNSGFGGYSPRDNRQTSHVVHSVLDERSDGKITNSGRVY